MKKNINRYKFSNEFIEIIKNFIGNTNYLDDDNFKIKYLNWKNDNSIILNNEKERLNKLGYNGNFYKKLDKSVYHYFKKLFISINSHSDTNSDTNSDTKIDTNSDTNSDTNQQKILFTNNICSKEFQYKVKREYLLLDFEFLQLIDLHINRHINNLKCIDESNFDSFKLKPSVLYNDFINLYNKEVNEQILKLNNILDNQKSISKIKKTYQNRYYNINNKL